LSSRHFVGLQLEIKQMKRKNTTSIKTNETKKNIAPVDIIEVSKIVDLPNTEPPLYRKDEYFTPAATSAPIVSSLRAQLRKDLWDKDPSGLASFLHQAKGKASNIIEHYITNPGDISLLPWEEALQIIDKFGTNTAKLHLIFAAHTMRQEKPWESKFTLSANDIIAELGWDKRTDLKKTQKLKEIAKLAFALGCLTIQATWIEGRGNNRVSCSVQTSRIWETYIDVQSEQQLNLEKKINESTDVYITVRPGLWTDAFLNRAGCEARKALYQFGYLSQDILKIDPYQDDLALRLGLHLTVESRFHTSGTYKVQTLLEVLLPKTVINEALENRDKAYKLTKRWNHALEVLSELKRAFQIEFDPTTYPEELRPNSKMRKPRGYFEQLLAAKITIHPPAPIPELLAAKTQPRQVKPKIDPPLKNVKEPTAQTTTLTGTQIKNARKTKGWSQEQLAGFLGVSQNLISLIERDKRLINKKLRMKIGKLLEI
jgi:DNA-binding XRE family transcriptional regulator